MATGGAEPVSVHYRLAAISIRGCQDLQVSGAAVLRQSANADDGRRWSGAGFRCAAFAGLVHAACGFHSLGRNGFRLFHRPYVQAGDREGRPADIPAAAQWRHPGHTFLFRVSLSVDGRWRTVQPRCDAQEVTSQTSTHSKTAPAVIGYARFVLFGPLPST